MLLLTMLTPLFMICGMIVIGYCALMAAAYSNEQAALLREGMRGESLKSLRAKADGMSSAGIGILTLIAMLIVV